MSTVSETGIVESSSAIDHPIAVAVEHLGDAHHDDVVVVDERHGDRTVRGRRHGSGHYPLRGVLPPPLGVVNSTHVEQQPDRPDLHAPSAPDQKGSIMIVLGIVLIVLGLLLPTLIPTFAFAHVLLVIGVLLLVVGAVLAIAGSTGRAVGGRRHYY